MSSLAFHGNHRNNHSVTFVQPDTASVTTFVVIVAGVLSLLLVGVYFAHQRLGVDPRGPTLRVALGLLAWIALTSAPVATGVLERNPMPGAPLFFVAVNGAALAFALSRTGKKLALGLPLAALVAFQAFRLPLELVLHSWFEQGTIPETMTWSGQNPDIVTGIVALVAAPFAAKFRPAAWTANIVGAALLVNVARVAIFSLPLPFAWKVEPPLQLVFHLPFAWIGSVCVAGALAGHVILTRALLIGTSRARRSISIGSNSSVTWLCGLNRPDVK